MRARAVNLVLSFVSTIHDGWLVGARVINPRGANGSPIL
jgi:hypothetical protein